MAMEENIGANVFAYNLAEGEVSAAPDSTPTKFVVEDNVGEAIHIHVRNIRLEMSIDEFDRFASNLTEAVKKLEHGNY